MTTGKRPQIFGANCVLLGSFNPSIIKPVWLIKSGLLRSEEIEGFKDLETPEEQGVFFHHDVCSFSFSDVNVRMERGRFQAGTSDESKFEILRDFVFGIFSILEHTPISAMGINTRVHYEMKDKETWNSLGDLLAPKEIWENTLSKPGMLSINMQGENPLSEQGFIRIKVEPSTRVNFGVFVEVNNHFKFEDTSVSLAPIATLKEHWSRVIKESFELSKNIIEKVM